MKNDEERNGMNTEKSMTKSTGGHAEKSTVSQIVRILLWAAVGAVMGLALGIMLNLVKVEPVIAAAGGLAFYRKWAWSFQTAGFAAAVTAVCVLWRRAARLAGQGYEAQDRADGLLGTAIAVNELHIIGQFLLFGLAVERRSVYTLVSVVLFLAYCLVLVILEVPLIRLVKRMNPLKRGNVGDLHFDQTWLESCDEAEKLQIYRCSYQSFQVMKSLLPILEAAALLGKMFCGTGDIPIITVCLIWAIHSGTYFWYCGKERRTI